MILRTQEIMDAVVVMKKMLLSSFKGSSGTLLQLKADSGKMTFHMSDSTYDVLFSLPSNESLDATIDAELFLTLIPKITSETLELEIVDNVLVMKGSGTYKFPIVFRNDIMYNVPTIDINNVTKTWKVSGDILNSILVNNSTQLGLGVITNPVQRLFYVDKDGCITFTTGACISKFDFGEDVKMLLPITAVSSFSLFAGKEVTVSLGYDVVSSSYTQPKLKVSSDSLVCTYILPFDDASLASFPSENIRNLAFENYANSVVLDCDELSGILDRIAVFADRSSSKNIMFEFSKNTVTISTLDNEIKEVMYVTDYIDEEVKFIIDLRDIKATTSKGKHVTLNFSADSPAVVLVNMNVYTVIPKIEEY